MQIRVPATAEGKLMNNKNSILYDLHILRRLVAALGPQVTIIKSRITRCTSLDYGGCVSANILVGLCMFLRFGAQGHFCLCFCWTSWFSDSHRGQRHHTVHFGPRWRRVRHRMTLGIILCPGRLFCRLCAGGPGTAVLQANSFIEDCIAEHGGG